MLLSGNEYALVYNNGPTQSIARYTNAMSKNTPGDVIMNNLNITVK